MEKILKSINPYTGEIIGEYPEISESGLEVALKEAGEAFDIQRLTTFSNRSLKMKHAARILRQDGENLSHVITHEMGKPIKESRAEIEKCAWVCDFYADKAEEFLSRRYIKTDAANSFVSYQPLGTILAVMPWNFPFWQVFRFAAPALMAGNTALLKHASNVQGCAQKIENVFKQAGFERGVFANLTIGSSRVSAVLESPIVKAATLTGSENAGSAVAEISGRLIKKTVLELGGNNAFVVLEDADLESAIDTAIKARLQNGGQSCIAAKRFLIEEPVYDDFIEGLKKRISELVIGDPMEEKTDMGPLSSEAQAEQVEDQVDRSRKEGAKLTTGGKRKKTFFDPTILERVKPGMPVFDEEVFGPVFAITKVSSIDEAVDYANQSTFGLGINVFTKSVAKAKVFVENSDEGAVFINEMVKSDPRLPFGGVKRSGYGRELSKEGIREFVNIKTVYVNDL
ncbi:MAG: NAD-dependent succinate-semialdehyde dehydrogenase [Bacteroidales bacterium]